MTLLMQAGTCSQETKRQAADLQKAWISQGAKTRNNNPLAAAQKNGEKAHDTVIAALERAARRGDLDHRENPYRQHEDPVWVALRPFLMRQGPERRELVETIVEQISDEKEYREAAERAASPEARERLTKQAEAHRAETLDRIAAWTAEIDKSQFQNHPAAAKGGRPRGLDRKKLLHLAETAKEEIHLGGAAERRNEMLDEEDPFPITGTENPDALYEEQHEDDWDPEEGEPEDEEEAPETAELEGYNGHGDQGPKTYNYGDRPKGPPIRFDKQTLEDLWNRNGPEEEPPAEMSILLEGEDAADEVEAVRQAGREEAEATRLRQEARKVVSKARNTQLKLERPEAEPLHCRYRPPALYSRETLERAAAAADTDADTEHPLILIENSDEGRNARDEAHFTAVRSWRERTLDAERRLFNYSEAERIEHRVSPGYHGPRLGMTTKGLQEAWKQEREGQMPRHWLVQSDSIDDEELLAALQEENRRRCALKGALGHYRAAESKGLSDQELRKRLKMAQEARWSLHKANEATEAVFISRGLEAPPHEEIEDPPAPEQEDANPQTAMALNHGAAPPKPAERKAAIPKRRKPTEGRAVSMFG